MMNLAFCLFRFFPYGGLERDFLRIAKACQQRGHLIHVYTMRWEGPKPDGFIIHLIKPQGWTNHGRALNFVRHLENEFKSQHYDAVIGFNRMPFLDFYFCADICFVRSKEKHGYWYRYTRRYKNYLQLEEAVFSSHATTKILYLTPNEKNDYQAFYQTAAERFYLIPPGIEKNHYSDEEMRTFRKKIRSEFNIDEHDKLLLMVGSCFKRKGVERSIHALASLPKSIQQQCKLFIIGRGDKGPYLKLAKKYDLFDQVKFLGVRDDVRSWMMAADLLLHPASFETAGMVIVEALTRGLPLLITENCGYAFHVHDANAGLIIPTPFDQQQMNGHLLTMLQGLHLGHWRKNALNYAEKTDLYSMAEKIVGLIEKQSPL
jgi:UDP-glucose:(heptosyl)LPS alpha-1,3-glucosyltransferase